MNLEQLTELVLTNFTSPQFSEELQRAKTEFFERAGIIDEESNHFEARMSQFLDWYLFTRDLSEYNVPPLQLANEESLLDLRPLERDLLLNLSQAQHSLYEFLKVKGSDVYIKDLFTKKKYILKDSRVSVGFNPEEIFDTRIISNNDNFEFTKGFCFHPPGAKKFILKEIKKVKHLDKTHHEALMFRLLKMRYKMEQYKHIKMEFIYTNDHKLKI